ncbi:hypothetical protein TKK_0017534 [Trichogramma kaykai]|uniref:Exonuclease domain-containing protein n=1 Tax=Trichogramma kaykai TaxID=54128 RepID=A0ABD2W2J4_9HYME
MSSDAGEQLYNKIDTFVFFDLETTDLIKGSLMPRILELSMVAVSRNSLQSDKRNRMALPRIMQKLTLIFNPMQPINYHASMVSNLWIDNLQSLKPFDQNAYNTIMEFLKRLPGIICFVAHNGRNFDYPVFLSELEKIQQNIPDSILCVDSFDAFKEFFTDAPNLPDPPMVPQGYDEVDEEEMERMNHSNNSIDDNWDGALCMAMDAYELNSPGNMEITRRETCSNNSDGKDVLDAITNKSSEANTSNSTPAKSNTSNNMQELNETTPSNQMIRSSMNSALTPCKKLNNARRVLNYGNTKPKNFKLCSLHKYMTGQEAENQHSAEGDCISMLRCMCQMGIYFAEWADSAAISMNYIKKTRQLRMT